MYLMTSKVTEQYIRIGMFSVMVLTPAIKNTTEKAYKVGK